MTFDQITFLKLHCQSVPNILSTKPKHTISMIQTNRYFKCIDHKELFTSPNENYLKTKVWG